MSTVFKQLTMYVGIAAVVVGGVTVARTAEAGVSGFLGSYQEECWDEGCVKEERTEMYFEGDYQEECHGENCSMEERVELACDGNECTLIRWSGNLGTPYDASPEVTEAMQDHWACADGRNPRYRLDTDCNY